MKRASWLAGLVVALAVTACTSGGGETFTVSQQEQTYHTSRGWSIVVPAGWHLLRFSDSQDGSTSAGIQVSNLRLPRPTLITGYPQVPGVVFPAQAVGLIIATGIDPMPQYGRLPVPPLSYPKDWPMPSTVPNRPYLQDLWFRADGQTLLATAEIGPHVSTDDLTAVAGIVHSLRP